jgi:hypothetical protein
VDRNIRRLKWESHFGHCVIVTVFTLSLTCSTQRGRRAGWNTRYRLLYSYATIASTGSLGFGSLQPCKALRRSSNQKTSNLLKAFSFYSSPPLLAMSMLQQHHNDHQSIADPASQALQHELIGLNQDTGHYHIFYDGSWRLCSIQDPYTIAEILAARQQGKVFTL